MRSARARDGAIPETTTIPVREALRWITIEGARMLGREDRIGSLAPGKLADLVMHRCRRAQPRARARPGRDGRDADRLANIEAVMIGGVWKKRGGRLVIRTTWTSASASSRNRASGWCAQIEQQGRAA